MSAHKNCHAHGYVRTCVSSFLLALFLFFIFPLIFSKGNNFRVSFGTPPEEKENRILLLLLLLLPVALLLFFFRSRQKFYCIHQVHSWVCRRLQLLSATRGGGGGGGGGVAMHVVEFLIMMMMILWIIHSLIDCLFVCLFVFLLACLVHYLLQALDDSPQTHGSWIPSSSISSNTWSMGLTWSMGFTSISMSFFHILEKSDLWGKPQLPSCVSAPSPPLASCISSCALRWWWWLLLAKYSQFEVFQRVREMSGRRKNCLQVSRTAISIECDSSDEGR